MYFSSQCQVIGCHCREVETTETWKSWSHLIHSRQGRAERNKAFLSQLLLYSRRTQSLNLGNDALHSGPHLPISIDLTSARLKTIHQRCVYRPASSKQPMLETLFSCDSGSIYKRITFKKFSNLCLIILCL